MTAVDLHKMVQQLLNICSEIVKNFECYLLRFIRYQDKKETEGDKSSDLAKRSAAFR